MPEPVRKSFLTRVHFFWMMGWVAIAAIPIGIAQVIGHHFAPTSRHFKFWAGLWSRFGLLMGGIRVRTEDLSTLSRGQTCVFASNHQSLLDIFVLSAGIPYPMAFVAKAELREWPIIGPALKRSPSVFVDRSTARRAVATIAEAADSIRGGNSMVVFPEGERTYSGETARFMKGAFRLAIQAQVPLVPVAIVNAYAVFNERIKASRPGVVDIVIGEPIPTDGKTTRDVAEMMAMAEQFMRARVGTAESARPDAA
jgi:1-acyl-sn-glycerol-3-phosphate acyltransferase